MRPLCAAGVLLLLGACAHKAPQERIVAARGRGADHAAE